MKPSRKSVVIGLLGAVTIFAGCGGTAKTQKTNTATSVLAAGVSLSKSAKMICEQEAANDVAGVLGVKATKPVAPNWSHGLFSCRYVYPNGEIDLSVKELSNAAATEAYYVSLRRLLGQKRTWANLGQAAFVTPNGSVVVRKDNKVLLVDISKLPSLFGVPPTARSNAALNVAITIMDCWTGA